MHSGTRRTCTVVQVTRREYLPRLADERLSSLLAELPAVMVTGPRAAGKTTSARRLAADVLRLDDPAVAAAVRADPGAALRRAREPALIDEWQEVPSILGAVKRAVDDDPRPGRFLLTGSAEADVGTTVGTSRWPSTGRVVRVVLHGLTQREVQRTTASRLLPTLVFGSLDAIASTPPTSDVNTYVRAALASGFPEPALRLGPAARRAWLEGYLEQLVTRDVRAAGHVRDPVRLRRYLEVLGLSTAGLPATATLRDAAGINQRTADAYDDLLEGLYLVERTPPWTTNRLNRLTKRAKRYFLDPGLAAAAARLDADDVLGDGDLLGRTLDTFVAAQLRPEVALHPSARLHHLRTSAGEQEVDLLVDLGRGRVIGIEIKAGSAPTRTDATHLMRLRDALGDDFVRGVVFHTGPVPFELETRIWALPIWTLWAETDVRS